MYYISTISTTLRSGLLYFYLGLEGATDTGEDPHLNILSIHQSLSINLSISTYLYLCIDLSICLSLSMLYLSIYLGSADAADAGGDPHQEHGATAKHGFTLTG